MLNAQSMLNAEWPMHNVNVQCQLNIERRLVEHCAVSFAH